MMRFVSHFHRQYNSMEGIRAFRLCHNIASDINPDRFLNQGILGFPADHDGRSKTRAKAPVFALWELAW